MISHALEDGIADIAFVINEGLRIASAADKEFDGEAGGNIIGGLFSFVTELVIVRFKVG